MFGQVAFEPRRARRGDERPGAEQSQLGMLPAKQCLDPDHRAARDVILRLIMDHDLVVRQRRTHHGAVARRGRTRKLVASGAELIDDRFVAHDQRGGDSDREASFGIADHRLGERDVQRAFLRAQGAERQRHRRNDQEARPVEALDAASMSELVAGEIFEPPPDLGRAGPGRAVLGLRHGIS